MKSNVLVQPWDLGAIGSGYDLFLTAVGYEKRASYIARRYRFNAPMLIACAFPDRKVHSYSSNLQWFKDAGFGTPEVSDREFREWFHDVLAQMMQLQSPHHRMCIDISSLNRFRMAEIIEGVTRCAKATSITIDFLYCLAAYSPPSLTETSNTHVGPVTPHFAGWATDLDAPPSVIVGLGYENDKALGAVEHIQAGDVWPFLPESPIPEYLSEVIEANRILLESVPAQRQLRYPVDRPFDCFVHVESISASLSERNAVVLLPFGPKIFSICALLVSCVHPEIAVWRVSAGESGDAPDREPTDNVYGIRAEFKTT